MTVMRIINEPTAAAIAYGLDKKEVRVRLGKNNDMNLNGLLLSNLLVRRMLYRLCVKTMLIYFLTFLILACMFLVAG